MNSFLLEECHLCPLWEDASQIVLGDNEHYDSDSPTIFFLGEAPGRDEDRVGKPFIGRAGKLLRKCIKKAQINSYYICNTVKCRPPNNRTPHWNEMNVCGHYTLLEIAHINPDLIVTLGKVATEFLGSFMDPDKTYAEYRNKVWPFDHPIIDEQYQLLSIFHPAYILRNREKLSAYEKMLVKARKLVEE